MAEWSSPRVRRRTKDAFDFAEYREDFEFIKQQLRQDDESREPFDFSPYRQDFEFIKQNLRHRNQDKDPGDPSFDFAPYKEDFQFILQKLKKESQRGASPSGASERSTRRSLDGPSRYAGPYSHMRSLEPWELPAGLSLEEEDGEEGQGVGVRSGKRHVSIHMHRTPHRGRGGAGPEAEDPFDFGKPLQRHATLCSGSVWARMAPWLGSVPMRKHCMMGATFALILVMAASMAFLVHWANPVPAPSYAGGARLYWWDSLVFSDASDTDTTEGASDSVRDKSHVCRTTTQGWESVVDDRGRVCTRSVLDDTTGCCPTALPAFSCDGCASRCCDAYERCVSCCMDPEHVLLLRYQVYVMPRSRPHGDITGNSIRQTKRFAAFPFCQAVCRTSSKSLTTSNTFKSDKRHCYALPVDRALEPSFVEA